MPRKPKSKNKRKHRRKKTMLPKVIGGFPDSQVVTLKYVEELKLDTLAADITYDVYRANGAFDPYQPVGGHFPMRWNKWSAIYGHYTVLKSKMRMTYVGNSSASNVIPSYFGIILSDQTTAPGGLQITDLFENINTTDPRLAGMAQISNTPTSSTHVTKYFSANKFFGTKNIQDGGTYGAAVTTVPAKQAYYSPYAASVGGSDGGEVTFLIQIEYEILFDQLDPGAQNT